ncbi:MAG: hypothetical protein ACTSX6_04545 [Candidatus Heimdallarchaeaceae archaeon]
MIRRNGNNEFVVGKNTFISLGVVISILIVFASVIGFAYAQKSDIEVIKSSIESLKEENEEFVPRPEIENRFILLDKQLNRIEQKLDRLLEK